MDKPLDYEQLAKRIEWLDNEHREDKTVIAGLQNKLENLETENKALRVQTTDLESEITRLNTLMARLTQFEQEISGLQTNVNRVMDDLKNTVQEKQLQTDKNKQRIDDFYSDIIGLQKSIKDINEMRDSVEGCKEENLHLSRSIEEIRIKVDDINRFDDDYQRSIRMIEESHRQDMKRLTDIQGEVSALRKRQDETRAKQDLAGDTMRKFDTRIKDLLDAESERREAQTAFIEKLNMAQVDRDRVLKQWSERFDQMEALTSGLDEEISGLEETHRAVKQSQSALDEVTQRFERRVNEITEVQRLSEERFRQEWTTFKSDDQKRWSNYTLSQEEQHREMRRDLENLGNQNADMTDLIENLQEKFQQLGKENSQRLQTLLNTIRESIETYHNIFRE